MAILFKEEGHIYESTDNDKISWVSVTGLVSKFKPKFDRDGQAAKSAKNKRSKWYGMTAKEIIAAWDGETERAIKLGNFYHNQRENDMLDFKTIQREGTEVPIIKPLVNEEGIKISPNQKLEEGVYPEHLVFLKSVGICGQAPSDHPEFAEFLVECGIDSISLNPDSVAKASVCIALAEKNKAV